jgi:hypothetical protein
MNEGHFAPLEAVLRLVHAFAECGTYFTTMVNKYFVYFSDINFCLFLGCKRSFSSIDKSNSSGR